MIIVWNRGFLLTVWVSNDKSSTPDIIEQNRFVHKELQYKLYLETYQGQIHEQCNLNELIQVL